MPIKMEDSSPGSVAEDDKPLLQRFVELRKLGQGTYGKVQLALNRATNEEVAVKTIKKVRVNNEKAMRRIRREIQIMSSIRHPHIIHIQEVFETRQQIIIVMQYASGGELYDYLVCHEVLPDYEARRIFRQIVCAIYYCHKNKICHRDLKLENILLDSEGNAQIADFGLSNTFDDGQTMSTSCGSPLYASPEIVSGMAYKGPEVDCWSLGVLLYALVYGTMPFDGRSFKRLVMQIIEGRYKEPENKSSASSLIRRLLTPDAKQRATIVDVCQDPWMDEGYSGSFLMMAEKMAESASHQKVPPKCLENSLANGQSILQKSRSNDVPVPIVQKNIPKIVSTQSEKNSLHYSNSSDRTILNDVVCVVNKLIEAVDAAVSSEKIIHCSDKVTKARVLSMKKNEQELEKVDSAFVIPIFDVTSKIPHVGEKQVKVDSFEQRTSSSVVPVNSEKSKVVETVLSDKAVSSQTPFASNKNETIYDVSKATTAANGDTQMQQDTQACSLNQLVPVMPPTRKKSKKKKKDNLLTSSDKSQAQMNLEPELLARPNDLDIPPKRPTFMRTKHHVLNLARMLSMNYEKLKLNSMKIPMTKKKLPGKLAIPQTFTSPRPTASERRESVMIFPTISVSENKQKIQKKIEKIKRAALNKSLIIRSDTNTRLRIENFIRSQVRELQSLVAEEQRSQRASFENIDEQSFQTTYYRNFGDENTDSGIVSTEDDDYFCFLCSKATSCDGTSAFVSSATLDSIRRDSLYTSSHLHIPSQKRSYNWRLCAGNNSDFGLSRCKSEVHLPDEYLNYISHRKSELDGRTSHQQTTKDDLSYYFHTKPSLAKMFNPSSFILRSASDSVGLNINSAIEVIKLNIDNSTHAHPKSRVTSHFLKHVSNPSSYNESQSVKVHSAASHPKDVTNKVCNSSLSHLLKDEGIGNSNESFQSSIKIHQGYASLGNESAADENKFTDEQRSRCVSEPYLLPQQRFFAPESQNICKRSISASSLDILVQICEANLTESNNVGKRLQRCYTVPCVQNQVQGSEKARTDDTRLKIRNFFKDVCKNEMARCYVEQRAKFSGYTDWKNASNGKKSSEVDSFSSLNNIEKDSYHASIQQFKDFMNASNRCQKSSSYFEKLLMQLLNLQDVNSGQTKHISRAKSLGSELDSENLTRMNGERRMSEISRALSSKQTFVSKDLFSALSLSEYDVPEHKPKRKPSSRCALPRTKAPKPKPKKSFLQLLALKRVQEAEKELEKTRKVEVEAEEKSGSLLEALKTQGYKSVISQRFQNNEEDFQDPYFKRRIKTAEQLRAEVAQLNYMYYESQPDYGLSEYSTPGQASHDYNNVNASTETSMALLYNSLYNISQTPRQSVQNWLNPLQLDTFSNSADYRQSVIQSSPEDMAAYTNKRKSRHQLYRDSSLEDYSSLASSPYLSNGVIIDDFLDRYSRRQGLEEQSCLQYDVSDKYARRQKSLETQSSLGQDLSDRRAKRQSARTQSRIEYDFSDKFAKRKESIGTQSSLQRDWSDRIPSRRQESLETQSSLEYDLSDRYASRRQKCLETQLSSERDLPDKYSSRRQKSLETQSSSEHDLSDRYASRRQKSHETQSSSEHDLSDSYASRRQKCLETQLSSERDLPDKYASRRQKSLETQSSSEHDLSERYATRRQKSHETQSSSEHDLSDICESRRQKSQETQSSSEHDLPDKYASRRQKSLETQSSSEHDLSDRYASQRQKSLETQSSSEHDLSDRYASRRQKSLDTQSSSEHDLSDRYACRRQESLETQSSLDDDKGESVHDRIWRKSFYSRFNDRALNRRVKSTYADNNESFSDGRLGQSNGSLQRSIMGASSDRVDGYASLRSPKRKKSFCHLR